MKSVIALILIIIAVLLISTVLYTITFYNPKSTSKTNPTPINYLIPTPTATINPPFINVSQTYPVAISNIIFDPLNSKTLLQIGVWRGQMITNQADRHTFHVLGNDSTYIHTSNLTPVPSSNETTLTTYVSTEKFSVGQTIEIVRPMPINLMTPEDITITITNQMLENVHPLIVSDNGSFAPAPDTLAIVIPSNITWEVW
jgi:hypothetical protein